YSGAHLRIDDCESTGSAEVGFIGRVLLNAFNALEYGETNNAPDLVQDANAIFDSYLENGFTEAGFFREYVDFKTNEEEKTLSIRRQSEGAFAVLNYLEYERKQGRKHPAWEERLKTLCSTYSKLEKADGSSPKTFDDNLKIAADAGGSTPSGTWPLTIAYSYSKDKKSVASATKT